MTYGQASELLGISPEAVRRHAARHGWRRQRGNDGRARVLVTEREAGQVRTRPGGYLPIRPGGQLSGRSGGQTGEAAALADALAELRRRAEAAEARVEAAALRDAAQAEVARLREKVLAERERANAGLVRLAEAARLREAVVAERERGNAALQRAAEAEARLAAGSLAGRAGAQALAKWRAFLARWGRP